MGSRTHLVPTVRLRASGYRPSVRKPGTIAKGWRHAEALAKGWTSKAPKGEALGGAVQTLRLARPVVLVEFH
jgi:hypothetical protein